MLIRLLDIVFALSGLVLGFPVLILLTIIGLFDTGSPIFRQQRVGRNKRPFTLVKFRTMKPDTAHVASHLASSSAITPFGGFLRKTKLDELPQLWNVLRGDMSLVGPRPERPFFVEQFKQRVPQYMLRHKVKSGMTGWAQVNGWRGDTSIEKRIEYDLYYIENWSVVLDFKILWLTVLRGFFHRHAY